MAIFGRQTLHEENISPTETFKTILKLFCFNGHCFFKTTMIAN